MFTRSHLQEMKRRYASIYAHPVEAKVIEDGTIEGANQYKKDTPGEDIEKEFKEHCGVCGQGIKEDEVEGSFELQATMALDDAGVKSKWKKGKLYVAKRDIKKAEKALGISFKKMKKGAEPDLYYEEVEIDEVWKKGRYKIYDKRGKTIKIVKTGVGAKRIADKINNDPKTKDEDLVGFKVVGEEVELDEKGTAYPATVDTLRKIVKDKQHQTVMFKSGKALADLFTASAMVQVYDALKKPDMKKTFEKMITDKAGFMKTQAFAMKMIGK